MFSYIDSVTVFPNNEKKKKVCFSKGLKTSQPKAEVESCTNVVTLFQ